MPDILIRGMELPKNEPLRIVLNPNGQLFVDHGVTFTEYETVKLPEHGDLIDRDALLAEYERDERAADEHGRDFSFSFDSGGTRCTEWWIVQQKLMDAHAIVPSNKEETE